MVLLYDEGRIKAVQFNIQGMPSPHKESFMKFVTVSLATMADRSLQGKNFAPAVVSLLISSHRCDDISTRSPIL